MIDVFNSEFELSLRILLILKNSNFESLSIDRIAAIDFITVYGKDFGIVDYNLHGENNYRFSEFTSRRDLITKAIKILVVNRLVRAICRRNGFFYSISSLGAEYCLKLNDKYAQNYSDIVKYTLDYISEKSDRYLTDVINNYSILALRGGLRNE